MSHQHFFRVHFAAGESAVVLAGSPESALRLGLAVRLGTGAKKPAAKPVRAEVEGHAGTGADRCPLCTAPGYRPRRRTLTMRELADLRGFIREMPS